MTPWSCSGDGDDWTGLTAAIRNQRLDTDQEDIMDMTPLADQEEDRTVLAPDYNGFYMSKHLLKVGKESIFSYVDPGLSDQCTGDYPVCR